MSSVKAEKKQTGNQEMIFLISLIAAGIILYFPTFMYLWDRWMSDTQYSIAFLVPPISGYFIWKKWNDIKTIERKPTVVGLYIILFALIFHLTGIILDITGPSGVSLIILIVGLLMYLHSFEIVKLLWFPLAFLVFMIPVPGGVLDIVGLPLQMWASISTASMLRTIGIDVYREGVNLSVPGFKFEVALACSGMSSLVALVSVTAVFAYISKLPTLYKWILFALALPIALIANIIRITTIALVGYKWGPEAAGDIYHDYSSPILFMAAILFLFLLSWGFEWISSRKKNTSS
ncbi:MAG: exosortase/archaeosortase family protein [Armatimonadota bacterium]